MLSPAQLAQRLDQRFRLLAGGERGAVERHATLRAAIDWSYDLLAPAEQLVLARLSVFAGGCSLEAAESVCSGGGVDELDVLDLLAVLVARSLVVADDARLRRTPVPSAGDRPAIRRGTARRRRAARAPCTSLVLLRRLRGTRGHRLAGPGPVAVAAEGERGTGEPPHRAGVGRVARSRRASGSDSSRRRRRPQRTLTRHAARRRSDPRAAEHPVDRPVSVRSSPPPRRRPCSTARSSVPSSSASKRWMWRMSQLMSSWGWS